MRVIDLKTASKADLHIHSAEADGLGSVEEILEYVQERTDLGVVAITDHDELRGAFKARDIAARRNYRFEVIVGSEVTTRSGHLLVYFVEDMVKSYRGLEETTEAVARQGGLCVVPHPMSWLTLSVGRRRMDDIVQSGRETVAGVELFNPSLVGRVAHEKARALNRANWRLAELGGSDSHTLETIGSAFTTFPGSGASDLRRAVEARATASGGKFWGFEEHSRGAAKQVMRAWFVLPTRRVREALGSRRGVVR